MGRAAKIILKKAVNKVLRTLLCLLPSVVWCKPTERDRVGFRSKGELYSWIRAWIRARSALEHMLSGQAVDGVLAGRVQLRRSQLGAGCGVSARPAIAIWDGVSCAASAHGPELRSWSSRFAPGALVFEGPGARPLHAGPYEQLKLDEAQRNRTRLDFLLLPRFYFYFPGIVNRLCW